MTTHTCDVLIYGSSGGAIVAASAAADMGMNVYLLCWNKYQGGLFTGGLGLPDYVGAGSNDTSYGIMRRVFTNVKVAADASGADPAIYGLHANGLIQRYAPEWARSARNTELGSVTVVLDIELDHVNIDPTTKLITSLTLTNGDIYIAQQYGDGCYEIDLTRLCGVPCGQGRSENSRTYNESQAGFNTAQATTQTDRIVRTAAGDLWRGKRMPPSAHAGDADAAGMAYNWRMTLSNASDRIAFPAPTNGQEAHFVDWLDHCNLAGFSNIENIASGQMVNADLMTTNGGDQTGYPRQYMRLTSKADRLAFWTSMYYRHLGWYYYAQHAVSSPSALQTSVASWGLPAHQNQTEYFGTPGWSSHLYVREHLRPICQKVMTFQDILAGATQPDPIARGGYNCDSHTVGFYPTTTAGNITEGTIDDTGRSYYPIGFAHIKPSSGIVRNLLSFIWPSATRTVVTSSRMEPTMMVLGEAAGRALALGCILNTPVTSVPYGALRERLIAAGAVPGASI